MQGKPAPGPGEKTTSDELVQMTYLVTGQAVEAKQLFRGPDRKEAAGQEQQRKWPPQPNCSIAVECSWLKTEQLLR